MVEFELDEAKAFIEKNQVTVQETLDELNAELAFVKVESPYLVFPQDQITTCEVNIAHCYNYGVKLRASAATSS